jgi:hypothetical protein
LKNLQKVLLITGITLVLGGGYLLWVFHQRHQPGVVKQADQEQALSKDDLAVVKAYFPQHFDDLDRLAGTSAWIKNGYTMTYFPYVGGKVEFSKKAGLLPPDQRIEIKKAIKAIAPADAHDGIEPGGMQAFLVFTMPGSSNSFAVAVGVLKGGEEGYFTDMLLYYDDPHTIYSDWGSSVWSAIDAHQVKTGMSELETRMAIGSKVHVDGATEGDRTVTYEINGKNFAVTYAKNRATEIKSE